MSYLRGPLTRQQIKMLMSGRKTKDEGRKTKEQAAGIGQPRRYLRGRRAQQRSRQEG